MKVVFQLLDKKTKKKWQAFNFGLGDVNTERIINISENTYNSSLLEIMPSHIKGVPESKVINKEGITLKTLDSIIDELIEKEDVVFLKWMFKGLKRMC
ncbi:MAG: hypothetical protein ACI8RP_000902 [Urechidicola sp.]